MKNDNVKKFYTDLINGFYCKKCKTTIDTVLKINDNQLVYKCEKCKREWI